MDKKTKRCFITVGLSVLMLNLFACGNNEVGKENTESTQSTEILQESESETKIEIADAEDILVKTWNAYKTEERFEIMGGHFTSALVGLPAKYDLTQSTDLAQMYCFPENYLSVVDDAATMIDLYNAARFTVSAYHVTDVEQMRSIGEDIKKQVVENPWHGEKPEKLCVIKVEDQYVISVYGREALVDAFKLNLEFLYQKMTEVVVEEKLF